MSEPATERRRHMIRRVVWTSVAFALLGTVTAIYRFLTPAPRQLAGPEWIELEAGDHFEVEALPMGLRYRLRACDRGTPITVTMGTWTSGQASLAANPVDDPQSDLRIDGRSGGTLRIEAQSPTGRLLLFRE